MGIFILRKQCPSADVINFYKSMNTYTGLARRAGV